MKVVLFCGGFGMRMREYSQNVPKPLVPVGPRPIVWHLMKYYAHFGHKDFIICLGYQGEAIKRYFLEYDECLSNDFVLSNGGRDIELLSSDIHDWRITFVDTGLHTNIGGRLLALRHLLADEEFFLASYSDGLCDLPLNRYVDYARERDKTAMFLAVRPPYYYHVVSLDPENQVKSIEDVSSTDSRMNGGFFVLKGSIFEYMREGEELVDQPFQRLIEAGELLAYPYEGFWRSMDTFKDRQRLEDLWVEGQAPWAVWDQDR